MSEEILESGDLCSLAMRVHGHIISQSKKKITKTSKHLSNSLGQLGDKYCNYTEVSFGFHPLYT